MIIRISFACIESTEIEKLFHMKKFFVIVLFLALVFYENFITRQIYYGLIYSFWSL